MDLYWAYNGPTKYNSGYTSIDRSTTAGMVTRGALIRREANLYNVYTDTTADDYTTQYYTFVHSVDGVGIYTYEKTVAAKTRSFTVTAPASISLGTAFNLTVQAVHWDATNDTTYTPTSAPTISLSLACQNHATSGLKVSRLMRNCGLRTVSRGAGYRSLILHQAFAWIG